MILKGKKLNEKHKWFAWHPVVVSKDGELCWFWLGTCYRQYLKNMTTSQFVYSLD